MHKSKEDMDNLTKVYKEKLENQNKLISTKKEPETKPKIQELTLRKPRKQELETVFHGWDEMTENMNTNFKFKNES